MIDDEETTFLKQQINHELYIYQPEYDPGTLAQDGVSEKVFVGLIAPYQTGKSTLTRKVLELYPEIKPINTHTTRNRKPDDPAGYKTAEDGITFSFMRDAINNGEVVNYSVIPGSNIYATFPEDFPGKYSISPFLPTSIDHINKAGFERRHFVFVVEAGDLWRRFVEKNRAHVSNEEFESRMFETLDSISFALEHHEIFSFVENTVGEDSIEKNARTIGEIVLSGHEAGVDFNSAKNKLEEVRAVAKSYLEEE